MEDFTCLALEKVLTGFFPIDAYRDFGFSRAQIAEVEVYRRDVAARNDYAVFRKYFKRDMHASMVNNLARIGLLTERVRPRRPPPSSPDGGRARPPASPRRAAGARCGGAQGGQQLALLRARHRDPRFRPTRVCGPASGQP